MVYAGGAFSTISMQGSGSHRSCAAFHSRCLVCCTSLDSLYPPRGVGPLGAQKVDFYFSFECQLSKLMRGILKLKRFSFGSPEEFNQALNQAKREPGRGHLGPSSSRGVQGLLTRRLVALYR
jgi:hypothetical protein